MSTNNSASVIARAFFRSIEIPGFTAPYDRASLKVFYPARRTDSDEERNSGVVLPATETSPYPVVIMLPGINVGPEAYSWLAQHLAQQGVVTVSFTHVAEEMPGYISLTPGLDISALMPDAYGKRHSATAIAPIISELHALNTDGILKGLLDLEKIVLGGHSAGGTVALLNADPDWFPGVCGAFSYGAHSAAATALGYDEDALFALPGKLPTLIMGGTRDGCIANSAARYGKTGQASSTAAVERTFKEALKRDKGDCTLALIEGANHFSMAYPADPSTGRPFIDMPTTQPDEAIRELLADLVSAFIDDLRNPSQAAIDALLQQREDQLQLSASR
ncbi:MAG: hypothetical protein ABJK20_12640 [Halieaceae bacterium]